MRDGEALQFFSHAFPIGEVAAPRWRSAAVSKISRSTKQISEALWVAAATGFQHALFKVDAAPMAEILESWKKHTAFKANRLLHRRGEFWQADYWDTFMRDSSHELETRNYIEHNPTKAKLVLDPKDWPWSSARFRDEYGVLKL